MNLDNITYSDDFINEAQKSVLALKHFYDTLLITHHDKRDHIIRVPIHDFFIKYRKELESTIQWYNVPINYLYKPKTVSLELYKTTEMWLALMRLNGFINITEFDQVVIKVYNPADVRELINIFFKRERKIT